MGKEWSIPEKKEEKKVTVIDTATGETDEYDVTIRLIDNTTSTEKSYKVMGILPAAGELNFDKMKSLIDEYFGEYNCDVASVGMRSSEYMDISIALLSAFASNGYMMFKENADGTIRIELDAGVVKWLHDSGSEISLYVGKANPEDMTEEQRKTVGSNFAIEADLKLDGTSVSVLQGGRAEITAFFDKTSAAAYLVDPSGTSEPIESAFDTETRFIRFSVDHLSLFMVTEEEGSEFPIWPFYLTVIIEYFVIVFGLLLYCRRLIRRE